MPAEMEVDFTTPPLLPSRTPPLLPVGRSPWTLPAREDPAALPARDDPALYGQIKKKKIITKNIARKKIIYYGNSG
jgi:hypothetical protein